jgi:hypothetical protein
MDRWFSLRSSGAWSFLHGQGLGEVLLWDQEMSFIIIIIMIIIIIIIIIIHSMEQSPSWEANRF